MAALDHFLLAELLATPTGEVRVHALATGLRQGQAVALAQRRCRAGVVQFVASPRLRNAKLLLAPDTAELKLGSTRGLEARLALWLDWLRAHGVLRLAELEPGMSPQWIAPRWLRDPLVCACLGILLNPAPAAIPSPAQPVSDWLPLVPPASIAGLLRDAGLSSSLAAWLELIPPSAREPLGVPLLDIQDEEDGTLQVGWLSRNLRGHPFSLGEASLLRVGPNGWIEAALMTIDRGAPQWPTSAVDPLPPRDQGFQFRADPRLDQLLFRVQSLAEKILTGAAYDAKQAGAEKEDAEEGGRQFARHIERLLGPLTTSMTSRLMQRAWPVRGATPTLKRSRYLHGGGVPLARQRRQALADMAPELAMHVADGYCPNAAEAVDEGRPLLGPLAADWEVPVWAARRTLALLRETPSLQSTGIPSPEVLAKYVEACGPHAPAFAADDLRFLAGLAKYVPGECDGPNALAMLRASGREAAVHGWEGVCEIIEHYDDMDTPDLLLAWWHVLRDNVADVLSHASNDEPVYVDYVEAVLARWLQPVPLSDCIRLALDWVAVFWGHDPAMFKGVDLQAPRLFEPLSLCDSRVEVLPLNGHAALREEGLQMQHCIGSYSMAVVTGSVLAVSLACPFTGERATVALTRATDGTWQVNEASGMRNRPIAPESRMARAVKELLALLCDEGRLNAEALALYQKPFARAPRLFDEATDGRCLLSRLPDALARVALRCFPGDGPLDRRILRAANRACPDRRQAG